MSGVGTLTSFQRVSALLHTLQSDQRQAVLSSLTGAVSRMDPAAAEVAEVCRYLLHDCGSDEIRRETLCLAIQVAELLDLKKTENARHDLILRFVATIPDYLLLLEPKLANLYGTLGNSVKDLFSSATTVLYVCMPYMSYSGVRLITQFLESDSRPDLRVCLFTQLTSHCYKQNIRAVVATDKHVRRAGAQLEVRSPTEAQAMSTRTIAPMHLKLIVSKNELADEVAYVGTANMSLAGYKGALEGGVIIKGAGVKPLSRFFELLYYPHHRCEIPDLPLDELRALPALPAEFWREVA